MTDSETVTERVREAVTKTVAIVEDEFVIAEYLQMLCQDAGATVVGTANEPEAALSLLRASRPMYVLMDVRLNARRDGVDIANVLHLEMPDTKVIYITGGGDEPTMNRINSDHPYRILIKPIEPEQLHDVLA